MPPTQPDPPSRPRTRSWTKKEEEAKSKQNVNAKRRLDPSVLPDSSKGPQTRAQARLEKKTKAQSPSTKSLPKPLPSTQRGHRVQQKESASRQSAKRHKKPSNKLSKGRSSRRSITEPKKTPIPAQLQGSRSSRKQVGRRRRSQPSPTNNLERRSTTSPQKDKPIEKPNEKPHSDEQYPTSQANGRGSPSGNRSSILIDKGTRKDQPSQRFDEQLTTKVRFPKEKVFRNPFFDLSRLLLFPFGSVKWALCLQTVLWRGCHPEHQYPPPYCGQSTL